MDVAAADCRWPGAKKLGALFLWAFPIRRHTHLSIEFFLLAHMGPTNASFRQDSSEADGCLGLHAKLRGRIPPEQSFAAAGLILSGPQLKIGPLHVRSVGTPSEK